MRFRPANISLINRRHYLPRLLLILSLKYNDKNNPSDLQILTGSHHINGRVVHKPGGASIPDIGRFFIPLLDATIYSLGTASDARMLSAQTVHSPGYPEGAPWRVNLCVQVKPRELDFFDNFVGSPCWRQEPFCSSPPPGSHTKLLRPEQTHAGSTGLESRLTSAVTISISIALAKEALLSFLYQDSEYPRQGGDLYSPG